MSVVTFWGNGKVETAQTTSLAGIATQLTVEHNYKILLINTKHNDPTLEECFWKQTTGMKQTDLETGITGLIKAISSNKATPEVITNYTRAVFKDRLEVLTDGNILRDTYEKQKAYMKNIIKIAKKAYDLVFVDLDGSIEEPFVQEVIGESSLVVVSITQREKIIKELINIQQTNNLLNKNNAMFLMGRYDRNSKFNTKNVERTYRVKDIVGIPYNTLFFESANEGGLADFFTQYRKLKPTHPQANLVNSMEEFSEKMIYRLKELQMQNQMQTQM